MHAHDKIISPCLLNITAPFPFVNHNWYHNIHQWCVYTYVFELIYLAIEHCSARIIYLRSHFFLRHTCNLLFMLNKSFCTFINRPFSVCQRLLLLAIISQCKTTLSMFRSTYHRKAYCCSSCSQIIFFPDTVVGCGAPPPVENASPAVSCTVTDCVATYTCNSGITGSGNTATCQASGIWTTPSLTCSCKYNAIHFNTYITFGQVATV